MTKPEKLVHEIGTPSRAEEVPRVLILLAAYNGAPWIKQQLESILNQRGVDVRIVVRDDGSGDATRGIVEQLAGNGRVSVAPPAAPTGSASQNFFALIRENSAENFDYVAFSDQDDIWDPDKLRLACLALRRDEQIAGYSAAVLAFWSSGREQILTQAPSPTECDFLFEGAGQGCSFVLHSPFYQRVRSFIVRYPSLTEPIHYHDWAIYALARMWKMRWHFDFRPTTKYRQHGGNDTGARVSVGGITKRLSLIANGWYRGEILAITRLCLAANPSEALVQAWHQLICTPKSPIRQLRITCFFLRHGRRKRLDTMTLAIAAILGWI